MSAVWGDPPAFRPESCHAEKTGAITQQTGIYGVVFLTLAALFTFALIVTLVFMRDRFLTPPTLDDFESVPRRERGKRNGGELLIPESD